MLKLVLLPVATVACLIALPSAFAHGHGSSHDRIQTHRSAGHSSHRATRDNAATDRSVTEDQANRSERAAGSQRDEEELAIDEYASTKAN